MCPVVYKVPKSRVSREPKTCRVIALRSVALASVFFLVWGCVRYTVAASRVAQLRKMRRQRVSEMMLVFVLVLFSRNREANICDGDEAIFGRCVLGFSMCTQTTYCYHDVKWFSTINQ